MRMKKFESKLRREVLRFSLLITVPTLIILGIVLATYNSNIREERLSNEIIIYDDRIQEMVQNHRESLFASNKDLFAAFLNDEESADKVYQAAYTFNASQQIKSHMVLLDTGSEVVFTTDSTVLHDEAYLNYMDIVIENMGTDSSIFEEKVYQRMNGDTVLNLVSPVIKNNRKEGYVVSYINGNEISRINLDSHIGYVIYDSHGNVFASSSDVFTHNITGKFLQNNLMNPTEESDQSYTYQTSQLTPSLLLTVYERDDSYLTVLIRSFGVLVIVAILLFIQSLYFSKKISRDTGESLALLMDEMNKVKEDQDYRLSIKTKDEFESLGDSINQMLMELSNTHAENITLSQLNMDAQRKKLEAQFNPHFLANTLETIRASLYLNPELADKLIIDLNKLMRYSIDDTKEATFEEDQSYLEHYLSIHKERYDDFDYAFKVDEKLNELIVPKLFLLPLIENSLKYGFKNKSNLKVIVEANLKEDETVRIKVKDNARAISKQKCEQLNIDLNIPGKMGNHHGLKNSKNRLEFMYPGSDFKIDVNENYTIVDIHIIGGETDVSRINR